MPPPAQARPRATRNTPAEARCGLFNTQIEAARAKYDTALASRNAAKAATLNYHTASDDMTDAGRGFAGGQALAA